ncbi:MAG: hypothetical protein HY064_12325 [Bacteroidetes bacterium]|nr:hypothetical protein [Bacteroidota bacterium]
MRKYFSFLFFISIAVSCVTYDPSIIYHRNFSPGTNSLLRFDGYYSDTLSPEKDHDGKKTAKPVLFFRDGSAFSFDNYFTGEGNVFVYKGSWGNYLLKGDSITLEKFQLIESNYTRIIMKGTVEENKIHWTSRKEHNEDYQPVDYSILFTPSVLKASLDSTKNFTRTKKKYNQ